MEEIPKPLRKLDTLTNVIASRKDEATRLVIWNDRTAGAGAAGVKDWVKFHVRNAKNTDCQNRRCF